MQETPATIVMPQNEEVEQALLGALLVDNRSLEKVSEFLRPEHFFNPVHGRIYDAIFRLVERGQLATPITLKAFFANDDALSEVGGAHYLVDLAASVVMLVSVEDYGRILYDLHLRRELISLGGEISSEAQKHDLDGSATEQIEVAEKRLYELATLGDQSGGFVRLDTSAQAALDMASAAFRRQNHVTGVTTGLRDLDRRLGGLHPSDLLILAARPAMGKTALATNIGFNAAKAYKASEGDEGAAVMFFSLEMSAEQLALRILAEISGVSSDRIRRGDIAESDFGGIVEASKTLMELPFFVDATPALSIAALRTRARRMMRQSRAKHGLLIVDYLQLLNGSAGRKNENRVQEISEISRGLKTLAKELNVPVIALSQLSRAVESREDKRPQLSDLRESGSIEQDADVVMFIYREEYYLQAAEPIKRAEESDERFEDRRREWSERCSKAHNKAEVFISKQRHGPTGGVELFFDAARTHFADLDQDERDYRG
ncbi:MAG TPA: replicative DNA helicase [Rhodospirillaceae bacterium]|nr:MAG: replicative DNA helicase [Alphaproteobacteria bacterium GWF2_58_20]HAU28923.1 replicative DNA helicase [Rhodospirillaceae bacterium]